MLRIVVIYSKVVLNIGTSISQNIFLVAAANRGKVLKIFISKKVTVYVQGGRLGSEKT